MASNREFEADRLFISGFQSYTNYGDVQHFFSAYGKVNNVYMLRDKHTGARNGKCFVSFEDGWVTDDVLTIAKKTPYLYFNGRKLRVSRAYKRLDHGNSVVKHKNLSRSKKEMVDESKCINAIVADHCLIKVMRYLNLEEQLKCRRVCRYWCCELVPSAVITTIEISAPHVVSLPFMQKYVISSRGSNNILSLCPQLQVLDLRISTSECPNYSTTACGGEVIDAIIHHCKQLKILKLDQLFFNEDEFIALPSKLPQLEELIAPENGVSNEALIILAQSAPNLRVLDIRENRELTTDAFENIPLSRLQKLDVSDCELLDAHIFIHLQESQAPLTHLSARDCIGPSLILAPGVEALSKFQDLEYLNLMEEDGSDLGEAGPICIKDTDSLKALQSLHKLKTLNIGGTICIHDGDVAAFIQGCPLLKELNMCGSRYSKLDCLTADGLKVLNLGRNLTKLDLSYINKVNKEVLEVLCSLPKLTSLALKDCPSISIDSLSLLVGSKLNELNISYNKQLQNHEDCLVLLKQFIAVERQSMFDFHFHLTGMSEAYLALTEDEQEAYTVDLVTLHYNEADYVSDDVNLNLELGNFDDYYDYYDDDLSSSESYGMPGWLNYELGIGDENELDEMFLYEDIN